MGDVEGGSQSKEELDRLRASKGALTRMIGGGNKTNKLLDAVLDEEKEDEAANQAALDARRCWTHCEAGEASELQVSLISAGSLYSADGGSTAGLRITRSFDVRVYAFPRHCHRWIAKYVVEF